MSATAAGLYEKAIKGITMVFNTIAMAVLAFMMFLGAADVIGRYVFNRPIMGTLEMSEVFLASMTMLGLGGTQLIKAHISVDLFTRRMSKRAKAVTYFITTLISLIIFAMIAWRAVIIANIYREGGRLVFTVLWPMGTLQLLVAIGSAVLCLVFILDLIKYAEQIKGGN